MYYYATPEHGILELKTIPHRNEDETQFIPRSTGIDGIDEMVVIVEDTPEEALEQLCRVIEGMFEEMYYYEEIYNDNEDQIDVAEQADAKSWELWEKACELVVAYGLYSSRNDEVSSTDDFGAETEFSFKSPGIIDIAKSNSVKFLDNTWFPGVVPVKDTNTYYYYDGPETGILSSVGIPRATEGRMYALESPYESNYNECQYYDIEVTAVRSTMEEAEEDLKALVEYEILSERGWSPGDRWPAYPEAVKKIKEFGVSDEMLATLTKLNLEIHFEIIEEEEEEEECFSLELRFRNPETIGKVHTPLKASNGEGSLKAKTIARAKTSRKFLIGR